jgi:hypothetical protein
LGLGDLDFSLGLTIVGIGEGGAGTEVFGSTLGVLGRVEFGAVLGDLFIETSEFRVERLARVREVFAG